LAIAPVLSPHKNGCCQALPAGVEIRPGGEFPVGDNQARSERQHDLADLAVRYGGVLKRYFEKRLRVAADVDDLVQEVFVRLAHRPDLASIERIDGYIFQVAANILRDRARRQAARRVSLHDQYDDELHSTEDFSPERVLLGREQLARLTAALNQLPARTRHVFVLCRFEGMKQNEIAAHLKLSVSGVAFHLARAKVHLAKALGREI
jgi:RNA polymerase sigma factor (sigma-70 family)